jgi:hypothetical protein
MSVHKAVIAGAISGRGAVLRQAAHGSGKSAWLLKFVPHLP